MNKAQMVLDSQILNNYQACPTKAYYAFILNAKLPIKTEDLDKGDFIHYMLKFHYKLVMHNQQHRGKIIPYEEIINIVKRKAENYVLKLDLPAELAIQVYKTYDEYARYYQNEHWQILEVERPFAKVLYEDEKIRIIYCGIIDLLTNVAIVDHKSSSKRGEPTGLSNQFMGYSWAFGVNNLVINKVGFQKTLEPKDKFERYTKSYFKEILDEWQENTIRTALELYDDYNNLEQMTKKKNLTSCDKYSGCIYRKLCESNKEVREFILSKNYSIGEPWKPLKSIEVI